MQHTKKMVMVPQDTYNSLLTKQQDIVQPLINKLINVDDQLEMLLNDHTIPADVKVQKYEQLFHRRQQMKIEQEKPMEIQMKDQPAAIVPQNIVQTLPLNAQTFAKVLLEHMSRHKHKINWDEKGQLIIHGQPIEGSHIVDLIHDFSKPLRSQVAGVRGYKEFSTLLKETNAPNSAIGNKQRMKSGIGQLPPFGVQIQQGSPIPANTLSETQDASPQSNQSTPSKHGLKKNYTQQVGKGQSFSIAWWK
jgi:hypothetical protein